MRKGLNIYSLGNKKINAQVKIKNVTFQNKYCHDKRGTAKSAGKAPVACGPASVQMWSPKRQDIFS